VTFTPNRARMEFLRTTVDCEMELSQCGLANSRLECSLATAAYAVDSHLGCAQKNSEYIIALLKRICVRDLARLPVRRSRDSTRWRADLRRMVFCRLGTDTYLRDWRCDRVYASQLRQFSDRRAAAMISAVSGGKKATKSDASLIS
jgi:hypothetical protein